MNIQADVLVVGGNLVGAAAALALGRAGFAVVLVDGRGAIHPATAWDQRIYAISPANRLWLEQLDVWRRLESARVAAVTVMRIAGDRGATLEFDAYRAHRPELAAIVESARLQDALWQALETLPNVVCLAPAQAERLEMSSGAATLWLQDGRQLSGRLLVGADGAGSWVRETLGISRQIHDYQQSGVVANFTTALAPQGLARQWFRRDGILAYLPLPGNAMSMVWSTTHAHAGELLVLPAAELCATVAAAGEHSLGGLDLLTPPAAFPLRRSHAAEVVRPRLVLLGDAAHTVHPLAGQGVNLGFGDAMALAGCLSGVPDPGDFTVLRGYARSRVAPVQAMAGASHGLARLFGIDDPLVRMLRNIGLGCVERLSPVKSWLVQQAAT